MPPSIFDVACLYRPILPVLGCGSRQTPSRAQLRVRRSDWWQRRPANPALGNGRLMKAARRAFIIGNGETTTGELADLAYALRKHQGKQVRPQHYQHLRDVLDEIADRIGRAGGRGRPLVWRLRNNG